MAYILDTNVFVRLSQQSDPNREITIRALRALRERNEDLCYTPQILNEFWNVCTRPSAARGGLGLDVQQVERKSRLIEKYCRLLPDSLATHQIWRQLVLVHSVIGVQVYDARLVASMNVYGVQQILTFNTQDFKRFPAVMAIHPKDVS